MNTANLTEGAVKYLSGPPAPTFFNGIALTVFVSKRLIPLLCISLSDEQPVEMISDLRMKVEDFINIKVIGRGAFGEVQLVSNISLHVNLSHFGLVGHKTLLDWQIHVAA